MWLQFHGFQNLHFISGGILCNLMLFNIFCFRITATRATLIGNKPQASHMRALHDRDDDDDLQDNINDEDADDVDMMMMMMTMQ